MLKRLYYVSQDLDMTIEKTIRAINVLRIQVHYDGITDYYDVSEIKQKLKDNPRLEKIIMHDYKNDFEEKEEFHVSE